MMFLVTSSTPMEPEKNISGFIFLSVAAVFILAILVLVGVILVLRKYYRYVIVVIH